MTNWSLLDVPHRTSEIQLLFFFQVSAFLKFEIFKLQDTQQWHNLASLHIQATLSRRFRQLDFCW